MKLRSHLLPRIRALHNAELGLNEDDLSTIEHSGDLAHHVLLRNDRIYHHKQVQHKRNCVLIHCADALYSCIGCVQLHDLRRPTGARHHQSGYPTMQHHATQLHWRVRVFSQGAVSICPCSGSIPRQRHLHRAGYGRLQASTSGVFVGSLVSSPLGTRRVSRPVSLT